MLNNFLKKGSAAFFNLSAFIFIRHYFYINKPIEDLQINELKLNANSHRRFQEPRVVSLGHTADCRLFDLKLSYRPQILTFLLHLARAFKTRLATKSSTRIGNEFVVQYLTTAFTV